jgi:hypothetical protein
MTNITTPLEGALTAIHLGFPAFPVSPKNKQPLIGNWPERATLDIDQAIHWWNQAPEAMVGVCMGKASGYWGIDIDVKDGIDAETKLSQLKQEFGDLDYLMMVRTPSGGLHLYCKMEEGVDIRNSTSKIAAGVDIRGTGGYLVFPGSIRFDGEKYSIIKTGGDND